jgi:REP element-mobilizing transposase RayT
MPFDPLHGHAALRRGRWSDSEAEYFLTFCTADRRPGLTAPEVMTAILLEANQLGKDSIWTLRSGVVMPDHVHLLVKIASPTGLAGAVRLFKGRLTPILRPTDLRWQPAYFDHRLRPNEDRLPVFIYIYLNPYRAKLLKPGKVWSGYFCDEDDWAWFEQLTEYSCPQPEWLA